MNSKPQYRDLNHNNEFFIMSTIAANYIQFSVSLLFVLYTYELDDTIKLYIKRLRGDCQFPHTSKK